MKELSYIALLQGIYYFVTGLWGLLHIESFMMVTGPKEDIWLVKTVSVLIIAISLVFLLAGYRKKVSLEVIVLAIACALGFIAIELYYTAIDRIWEIYLLDALAQFILIILWGIVLVKQKRSSTDT